MDSLERFRIVWIFSGWSRKFPDSLENFRIAWIFSGWSGKLLDSLESFQIIFDDPYKSLIMPKVFRKSSNILSKNVLCTLFLLQKQFPHACFVAKTIYAHFFCHKNDSCTLFLSQKQFLHTFLLQK